MLESMGLKWGILGPGNIARQFAKGLRECDSGTLAAAGSRSRERAEEFAKEFGGQGVEGYEAVLTHPEVEAVYIALPHHLHAEYTVRAARAGKHILCEKPFTLNALEAERALEEVAKNDVFFMEAWMYRAHPQTAKVRELVQDGAIGDLTMVRGEFGFKLPADSENFRADGAVGGGGLMDVGSYPVSFIRYLAGQEPTRCLFSCELGGQGEDAWGAGVLEFPSGVRGAFTTAIRVNLDNDATVYGTEGKITIPSPWICDGRFTLHREGKDPEEMTVENPPNLWGHQAEVVERYLADRESPTMSWDDTLGNMQTLDRLRASGGLRFAEEPRS
jgi:predicted dehydrogenase